MNFLWRHCFVCSGLVELAVKNNHIFFKSKNLFQGLPDKAAGLEYNYKGLVFVMFKKLKI